MPGLTLSQAEAKLALHLSALDAVLSAQEYKIADRSLKKASLADIYKGITFWNNQVKVLSRGGIRVVGGTPS